MSNAKATLIPGLLPRDQWVGCLGARPCVPFGVWYGVGEPAVLALGGGGDSEGDGDGPLLTTISSTSQRCQIRTMGDTKNHGTMLALRHRVCVVKSC